ncbi:MULTISPECIES: holo-ACP synthase [Dehalococcoides]|jgi:holo-[acyl-carrier protein] synthase|nr:MULTISPECIES: holo-ACP synthase [Dehalococcoides]AGG06084.1 holo-[acyl-carrier protein] synthase [Dehalococcoides mccartyi DCMB5]BAS31494.1 holo-[acyl-carrier protein] synthase [Dehalococcoides mccartyi IBARAKI]
MLYTGTDIIEIRRIKAAEARWGEHFLNRIFTPAELSLCKDRFPSLAARFAAKEAVIKALSLPKNQSYTEIETLNLPEGQPSVNLYGQARDKANILGIKHLSISLSHCREYAIAMVVAQD